MTMFVRGLADVADEGGESYWAEMEPATADVQRSDDNEIHIGVKIRDSETDDVSLYLTVSEAGRLAHLLGVAVLANEAAAHEAAKL